MKFPQLWILRPWSSEVLKSGSSSSSMSSMQVTTEVYLLFLLLYVWHQVEFLALPTRVTLFSFTIIITAPACSTQQLHTPGREC
jgi:hypothetical protein